MSGPALEIGRVALDDEAWLKAAAKRLAGDQEKLDALLLSAGFTILGGTTLFRLGEHPEAMRWSKTWAGREFMSALSPTGRPG